MVEVGDWVVHADGTQARITGRSVGGTVPAAMVYGNTVVVGWVATDDVTVIAPSMVPSDVVEKINAAFTLWGI